MAGTKRSSSSKSSKGGNPDFKRIKAKVGKRAIKPANVTDTSFKAASLHVTGQTVDHNIKDENPGTILSSRGRSLSELTLQLNHPAAAVRLSAMKGLGNVVHSTSKQPSTLRPHLSILIPACAKSSVDEDRDVRQVGLQVLKDLIQQQDEAGIRPFISLLVAYTTSALNSLDSAMRLDGARAVQLTSRAIPNLVSPALQTKMLPPFSSLLAERANKSKHSEEILQSLVSLLHTQEKKTNPRGRNHHTDPTTVIEEPDMIYIGQGRGVNALLLEGTRSPPFPYYQSVRRLERLEDMPAFEELDEWHSTSKALFSFDSSSISGQDQKVLSLPVTHELLSKLRDALVETTEQGGDEVVVVGDVSTKPLNMRKLTLLVQATRLLWNQSSPSSSRNHLHRRRRCFESQVTTKNDDNWEAKLDRLGHQITSLLLDVFPIGQEDAKPNDRSRIEDLNGELCSTIMDLAVAVESSFEKDTGHANASKTSLNQFDWIHPLCSYFHERLEGLGDVPTPTLDVIAALLLLQRNDGNERETFATSRVSILERIHLLFFPASDMKEVARSTAGRRVALSMRNIIDQEDYLLDDKGGDPLALVLHKIVSCLPSYLIAWRSDFLFESQAIIDLLHNVIRRISQKDHPLLLHLRTSLSDIVVAVTNKKSKKNMSKTLGGATGSILEGYPPSLQRKFLGLVVMAESPSEEIVSGLAAICARCNFQVPPPVVSHEIADCIVESIHMIRKTISMQSYLGFLVTSLGIRNSNPSKTKSSGTTSTTDAMKQVDSKWILSLDHGVRRVCRVLVQCGTSQKILQMLLPVLSQWLPSNTSHEPAASPTDFSVRARTAIAVATMLTLNAKKVDPSSSLFGTSPQLRRPMTVAIARMIGFGLCSENDHDEYQSRWMGPVIALCQCETSILKSLFQHVAEIIVDGTLSDPFAQKNTLETLIELVRDTRLSACMPRGDVELVSSSRSIESALGDDGPARQLGSRLVALLELNAEILERQQ